MTFFFSIAPLLLNYYHCHAPYPHHRSQPPAIIIRSSSLFVYSTQYLHDKDDNNIIHLGREIKMSNTFVESIDGGYNTFCIDNDCNHHHHKEKEIILIQQVNRTEKRELERMSQFCMDTFYNNNFPENDYDKMEDDLQQIIQRWKSMIWRQWKDLKLRAMQKIHLLDISLSSDEYFRFMFVAKVLSPYESNKDAQIVGCCEIIEERIDTSQRQSTVSERERRKKARYRPVIENLCVKEGYRKRGVGIALIQSCENAILQSSQGGGHDEVFTQVDIENAAAYNLFRKCGYKDHFLDSTCTKIEMDDTFFAREITATKMMMRKMLN